MLQNAGCLGCKHELFKIRGLDMPAESEEQKTTACMALAMKRGDLKKTPGTPAAEMAESMTEEQLVDYCGSKVKK